MTLPFGIYIDPYVANTVGSGVGVCALMLAGILIAGWDNGKVKPRKKQ